MTMFAGIKNIKSGTGTPPNLQKKLAEVVGIDQARAKATQAEAQIKAYQFVWALASIDPSSIAWVGVDAFDSCNLGQARISVVENLHSEITAERKTKNPTAEHKFDTLKFSSLLAFDEEFNGLPLPMLAHGRQPFSESGLANYPIKEQGVIGKTFPTKRVHTLEAYLNEPDVWPEQYRWLIPYMPVHHLITLAPKPKLGASEASSFDTDYCFMLQADRGLVIHRIIQDRILPGYIYTSQKEGIFALSSRSLIPLTDNKLSEDESVKYSLFRAEQAPTLNDNSEEGGPSVFGNFIFIVMQQPAQKLPNLSSHIDYLWSGSTLKSFGAEISGSSVGAGRELAPVSYGEGVEIDPLRLPTIFHVRVLNVRELQDVSANDIDQAAKIVPFPA